MINPNRKTELEGVHFVQGVVQNKESSFEPFSHQNDQGNDCYIEFVKNRIPTNYGVFVQIKSGPSFKDANGYKIPADKSHLEYWSKNLYKTIGIVYDPDLSKAFWVDISDYTRLNPAILNQKNHSIRVSSSNEFSEQTFDSFVDYCFQYKIELQSYENFGRSLELFSQVEKPVVCYEGLKSLYSNHRSKDSTWFYILSNFGKIEAISIRTSILGLLSNYVNDSDVFWHKDNLEHYPSDEMRQRIANLLTKLFNVREVEMMLPYMKEGVSRGGFSYKIFLVLDLIVNVHLILKEIAFNDNTTPDDRNFCFWLYMHIAKYYSIQETLIVADQYLNRFPYGREDDAVMGLLESIKSNELFPIG